MALENALDAERAFVERLLNGDHSLVYEEGQCQSHNISYNSRDAKRCVSGRPRPNNWRTSGEQ